MVNYNADLRLSVAIDNIKRKYPECFQAGNNIPLEEYVDPKDKDWLVVVEFRKRVNESEAILQQRGSSKLIMRREVIRYAIGKGLRLQKIADELGISKTTVSQNVRSDKELSAYYDQAQKDYKKIVIYNVLQNTAVVYKDVKAASKGENITQVDIRAGIEKRHKPIMLTGFKQAKRLLFYKIDRGMD